MECLMHLAISIGVVFVGLLFLIKTIIPRSTLSAIQFAVWHRIICGSASNAISLKTLVKCLLVILALLFLMATCCRLTAT